MSKVTSTGSQTNPLNQFFTALKQINPSVFLFLAAILAIIFANSGLSGAYFSLLNAPVNFSIGDYLFFQHAGRPMTFAEFVNDALMAFFFFSVGLEIKQEIIAGSLSSVKKAMLPVIAAIGGVIFPILFFTLFVGEGPAMRGMAIPMATDIAFALAVLGLLGKRVPITLKVFLMALAVVDDIAGILVIAIFYSSGIKLLPLLLGFAVIGLSYFFGRKGVVRSGVYYTLFFIVWSLFLHSGIHTTIAGVLLALTIPHKATIKPAQLKEDIDFLSKDLERYLDSAPADTDFLTTQQLETVRRTEKRVHRTVSPVQVMEHEVYALVNYITLPLFAFANSGISFSELSTDGLTGLPLAITAALFLGKTIGITLVTFIFTKLKVVQLSPGMTYRNVFGVAMIAGIGFTVSLFIATLAYSGLGDLGFTLLNQAKLGIFAGSIFSGITGFYVLKAILEFERKKGVGAYSQEYRDYLVEQEITVE